MQLPHSRVHLLARLLLLAALLLRSVAWGAALPPEWAKAWPVTAPLQIERLGTFNYEGLEIQRLRYTGSVWNGKPQRIYALYAHPGKAAPGAKFPAIVQIHGGGQTCFPSNVAWFAKHGYACISFDWGGPRDNRPLDQVTRWDPEISLGYLDRAPQGSKQKALFHAVLAARRAIDVLEQFPEVDAGHIGVQGVSWGGLVAWLVGGLEPRIKALVPVYGVGGLDQANNGEGRALRGEGPEWVRQWSACFDPIHYADHQQAPVMYLSASNDFFGQLPFAEAVLARLRVEHRRSYVTNCNHSMDPGTMHAGMAWFDHWLKAGPTLPPEPRLTLQVEARQRLVAHVDVNGAAPLSVRVDYARGTAENLHKCWLSQPAHRTPTGDYAAEIPLLDTAMPLSIMAHVWFAPDLKLSSAAHNLIPAQMSATTPGQTAYADKFSTLTISGWLNGPSGWFQDRSTDFSGAEHPAADPTTTSLDARPALVLLPFAANQHCELRTRLTADPSRQCDHALPLEIWTHDVARLGVRLDRLRLSGIKAYATEITPGPGWHCTLVPLAQFEALDASGTRPDPAGASPANWKEIPQMTFTIDSTPGGQPGLGQIAWRPES